MDEFSTAFSENNGNYTINDEFKTQLNDDKLEEFANKSQDYSVNFYHQGKAYEYKVSELQKVIEELKISSSIDKSKISSGDIKAHFAGIKALQLMANLNIKAGETIRYTDNKIAVRDESGKEIKHYAQELDTNAKTNTYKKQKGSKSKEIKSESKIVKYQERFALAQYIFGNGNDQAAELHKQLDDANKEEEINQEESDIPDEEERVGDIKNSNQNIPKMVTEFTNSSTAGDLTSLDKFLEDTNNLFNKEKRTVGERELEEIKKAIDNYIDQNENGKKQIFDIVEKYKDNGYAQEIQKYLDEKIAKEISNDDTIELEDIKPNVPQEVEAATEELIDAIDKEETSGKIKEALDKFCKTTKDQEIDDDAINGLKSKIKAFKGGKQEEIKEAIQEFSSNKYIKKLLQ